jgi:hypothetical protein
MKIDSATKDLGPYVLLVEPADKSRTPFVVGERNVMSQTVVCFETKESALAVAKPYESVASVDDMVGKITILPVYDVVHLKQFMSW